MLSSNPFFPLYDSDYQHVPSFHERLRYQQMKQREAEAAKRQRQAEMNRYYLRKEDDERQRTPAIIELEDEKGSMRPDRTQQDETAYQRHSVDERQRHQQQHDVLRRANQMSSQKLRQEKEDQWTVVRGPDGRLYRVALKKKGDDVDSTATAPMSNSKRGRPTEGPIKQVIAEPAVKELVPIHEIPKKRRSRKVTVIVEDASDDESEQDKYKSVWHNRRPSPGQWMEPLEF